jgi:hypothetical protein
MATYRDERLEINETDTPDTPPSGYNQLYFKTDANLYTQDDTGTETQIAVGDVSAKADKVGGAVDGNFAGLDASGNLTDSGYSSSDIPADTDELPEGATNLYFTSAEQTKLSGIETGADVTDETNVVSSLDGATLTSVTVATDDKVIIQDTSDSDNIKTVTAQAIADLGGGGGGSTPQRIITGNFNVLTNGATQYSLGASGTVTAVVSSGRFASGTTAGSYAGGRLRISQFNSTFNLFDRNINFGGICEFSGVGANNATGAMGFLALNADVFDIDSLGVCTTKHIGVIIKDQPSAARVYTFSNADGVTQTTTDITASVMDNRDQDYSIVYEAGVSAKLYVDGTLVATHTTNLPSGGVTDTIWACGVRSGASNTSDVEADFAEIFVSYDVE